MLSIEQAERLRESTRRFQRADEVLREGYGMQARRVSQAAEYLMARANHAAVIRSMEQVLQDQGERPPALEHVPLEPLQDRIASGVAALTNKGLPNGALTWQSVGEKLEREIGEHAALDAVAMLRSEDWAVVPADALRVLDRDQERQTIPPMDVRFPAQDEDIAKARGAELLDVFGKAMLHELRANAYKGSWLTAEKSQSDKPRDLQCFISDLLYHVMKLAWSAKAKDPAHTLEFAADVGNCAAFIVDFLGADDETLLTPIAADGRKVVEDYVTEPGPHGEDLNAAMRDRGKQEAQDWARGLLHG